MRRRVATVPARPRPGLVAPPGLCRFVAEDWLDAADERDGDEDEWLIAAFVRWRRARFAWADAHGLTRGELLAVAGPVGRPSWSP